MFRNADFLPLCVLRGWLGADFFLLPRLRSEVLTVLPSD